MIKKLSIVEDGFVLPLDTSILNLLGITQNTELNIEINNGVLVIRPINPDLTAKKQPTIVELKNKFAVNLRNIAERRVQKITKLVREGAHVYETVQIYQDGILIHDTNS